MKARWLAFVIWGAVAASAVFWALRLFVHAPAAPGHTVTVSTAAALRGDLTRLFGADARPALASAAQSPGAESRYQLLGVVASRSQRDGAQGLALIAVDGKPARAYGVGAAVDGETVLQSVSARGAALGPKGGVASIALEIPALPPPATGSLPAALSGAVAPSPVRPGAAAMARPPPPAPPPRTEATEPPQRPDSDARPPQPTQ
jgi:general secretion pathway protein C